CVADLFYSVGDPRAKHYRYLSWYAVPASSNHALQLAAAQSPCSVDVESGAWGSGGTHRTLRSDECGGLRHGLAHGSGSCRSGGSDAGGVLAGVADSGVVL